MKKLSLLDQLFFKLEEGGISPVYMAGGMVFDPSTSPYPLDSRMLADHLAARLEQVPLLRKKLVQDSFRIGHMRLVDDPKFDVGNHITLTRLKKPGGYAQLTECLGCFSAQRLDMSRPPWHFELIDGLQGGRIAVAMHLHHAVVDGIGAMQALGGVWDQAPVPAETPAGKQWRDQDEPTPFELLREALRENAERLYADTPAFLLTSGVPLVKSLANTLTKSLKPSGPEPDPEDRKVPKVRKTSLNRAKLSPQRVVSFVEFPLQEVKQLRRHYDCSINDLVLLFNSCALEHYFEGIDEQVDFDLIAAMPINIRKDSDESSGNAVTVARVNLHNTVEGIEERLQAIAADTRSIKRKARPSGESGNAVDGKALMSLFSPLLLDGLVYGVVKFNLLERATFFNTAITNVPGSQAPVYLAGAKQVSMIPMAPCLDSVALTITATSSDEVLAFGYHGCGETIVDKELFVAGARLGFLALKKSAGIRSPATRKRRAPRKRK